MLDNITLENIILDLYRRFGLSQVVKELCVASLCILCKRISVGWISE